MSASASASSASTNPYETPKTGLDPDHDAENRIWRDGRHLVTRRNTPLPDRCLKCDEPAGGARSRMWVFYYSPVVTVIAVILIFVFFPLALLVALIGRKGAKVEYALCKRHRARRAWLGWIALGIFAVPIAFAFVAGSTGVVVDEGMLLILIALGTIIGFGLAAVRGRPLALKGVDEDRLWLAGACEAYLAHYPKVRG